MEIEWTFLRAAYAAYSVELSPFLIIDPVAAVGSVTCIIRLSHACGSWSFIVSFERSNQNTQEVEMNAI